MKLSNRIRIAREHAGLTQKELADRVGISQTAVHKLECGRSRSSRRTVAIAIACDVDPIWLETGQGSLTGGHGQPMPLPRSGRDGAAIGAGEGEGGGNYLPGLVSAHRVPLFSWNDVGIKDDEGNLPTAVSADAWVSLAAKINEKTFALRVFGDTMETEFSEGDIIVVDPALPVVHNRYVVVRIPGEDRATFKQLIVDGGRRYLKPLNPSYPVMEIDRHVEIVGIVVSKFKEY